MTSGECCAAAADRILVGTAASAPRRQNDHDEQTPGAVHRVAGGRGSRLGPLTTGRAKPSLPVGGNYQGGWAGEI